MHSDGAHQWGVLHIHGEGHERGGHRFGIERVLGDHRIFGTRCSDVGLSHLRQHAGHGVLDGTIGDR